MCSRCGRARHLGPLRARGRQLHATSRCGPRRIYRTVDRKTGYYATKKSVKSMTIHTVQDGTTFYSSWFFIPYVVFGVWLLITLLFSTKIFVLNPKYTWSYTWYTLIFATAERAKYLIHPTGSGNRVVSDIYTRCAVSDIGTGNCKKLRIVTKNTQRYHCFASTVLC